MLGIQCLWSYRCGRDSQMRKDRNETLTGISVAIAVQRCTGMALQRSQWMEWDVAMGARAA